MPHIMELLGKTRVVVKDGKVIEVGEPEVKWCPLFAKIRGIQKITPEEVRKNMEFRISDFGMFTDKRRLELEDFVITQPLFRAWAAGCPALSKPSQSMAS
jgi:putative methanogenesis marker protein 8